jgi:Potential Queuosine, Q, salvage protein family
MPPEEQSSVPERVRAAAAWVADRAESVEIDHSVIPAYAAGLPNGAGSAVPAPELVGADRESKAAFAICLNAINFGSGWWPTIRKRPGLSGYLTIAAGFTEMFDSRGPWSVDELTAMDAETIARVVGQDPDHPLMTQFAASLRNVGTHLLVDHGGSFEAVVEAAGGSAVALADLIANWDAFADTSLYEGMLIPFYKRAQLAAADLDRSGAAELTDLDRLTAFADNLIPQVLRIDGVLRLDPGLTSRIEDGELIEHGSSEEVELRACAVHAVELLSRAAPELPPVEIDAALWLRGSGPRYKVLPRPRSRNTAY